LGNHSKGDAWFEGANDASERVSHNYWETTCRGIKRSKLLDPVLRRDISPGREGEEHTLKSTFWGFPKKCQFYTTGIWRPQPITGWVILGGQGVAAVHDVSVYW